MNPQNLPGLLAQGQEPQRRGLRMRGVKVKDVGDLQGGKGTKTLLGNRGSKKRRGEGLTPETEAGSRLYRGPPTRGGSSKDEDLACG